jgi:P4 family phage/plasmid primase-like protien
MDEKIDCANSNDTLKYIKVPVLKAPKASRFNTQKLLEIYGEPTDQLIGILDNMKMYEDMNDPAYNCIINTWKSAEEFRASDEELYEALIATCYYQIYKGLHEDDNNDALMDQPEEGDTKTKPKLNYNKLAEYLIKKYTIISHNGICYLYIGTQYFIDSKRDRLKKDITKILESIGYSDHTKTSDISKDIIDRIVNKTHKIRKYPFNELSSELVPVENGIVHRKLVKLLPHSPVFKMTYHLNVEFNPNIDPKAINEYLNSLVEVKEDADLLLQIPAQALLQMIHQIAYIFTGDGQNGKSTFIQFLQMFIGSENYTSMSLQDLTDNRFSKAELEGKLMNMYPDISKNAIKYSGTFKALTGGDEINGERKFGQPFKFRNKAVLCFAANELPEITDATWAFWRRWCVIPFPNKFAVVPEFIDKLASKENMSMFLNLVLNKMNRIETQGLTRSNRVEQACHLWKTSSSSAYAFVSDCIVKETNSKIWRPVLEDLYIAYCEEKDVTRQDFINVAKELAKIGAITARARHDNKLVYVYTGVKYTKENLDVKYIPYVEEDDEEAPELKMKE